MIFRENTPAGTLILRVVKGEERGVPRITQIKLL